MTTFVTGTVVMEDGSPLPGEIVIERVCGARSTKESYVNRFGQFGFELGGSNSVFADASDGAGEDLWGRNVPVPGFALGASARQVDLVGCELRAASVGYRSSSVMLSSAHATGQLDVGSIVLSPIARVIGSTVSAVSLQAPKNARKAFERAGKALEKFRFGEAERHLNDAVASFPRYATAWHELGELYRKDNRADDARAAFTRALEADEKYVNPYIGLARLAGEQRRWEDVASLTSRAVELNPLDFPEAFYFNAIANFQLQRFDAAERGALKALRIDSRHRFPQAHLLVAEILAFRRDSTGEASQLRDYLRLAPEGASAGRVRDRLAELAKAQSASAGKPEQP